MGIKKFFGAAAWMVFAMISFKLLSIIGTTYAGFKSVSVETVLIVAGFTTVFLLLSEKK